MENPQEPVAVRKLIELAQSCGANTSIPDAVTFSVPEMLQFCEKISEQVFRGTCTMMIQLLAQLAESTRQQVDLAKTVTKEELDGSGRTGSY